MMGVLLYCKDVLIDPSDIRSVNKGWGPGAPVVGVLLYRKHVITDQLYIPQLIRKVVRKVIRGRGGRVRGTSSFFGWCGEFSI